MFTILLHVQAYIRYFSQSLSTLDLSNNEISDYGVAYLANGLEANKVTWLALFFSLFHHRLQTLTVLMLGCNLIGTKGVEYLANTLQQNKVYNWYWFSFYFIIHSLLFFTDTHQTGPWQQSSWWSGNRASCACFTTE